MWLLALGLTQALANGGPYEWTTTTPFGEAGAQGTVRTELVREELAIRFVSPVRYRVEARYFLRNPDSTPEDVRLAVPLTWHQELERYTDAAVQERRAMGFGATSESDASQSRVPPRPNEVASGVTFSLNGTTTRCGGDDDVQLDMDAGYVGVRSACVATVVIPSGGEHVLTMTYEGEVTYEDLITNKSPFGMRHTRDLTYPLFPASAWAGRPERLDVTLDMGPNQGMREGRWTIGEEERRLPARKGQWQITNPDLEALGRMRVSFFGDDAMHTPQEIAWINKRYGAGASASSTLAPQPPYRYDASHLVDGNLDTAWCESVDGTGEGEWFEVRARVPGNAGREYPIGGCSIVGVGIVPGYARSLSSWNGNGRVTAIEIGPCGGGGPTIQLPITGIDGWARRGFAHAPWTGGVYPPLLQTMNDALDENRGPVEVCARMRILGASAGKRWEDTCVSEAALAVNCQ